MEVLVFGNSIVEADSLPWKVAEELMGTIPGVMFKKVDMLTDLIGCCSDPGLPSGIPIVLDVAIGIDKVETIRDFDKIEKLKVCSAHDLDLAFELKLLRKTGDLKEAWVIAVPMDYKFEKAVGEVREHIEKLKKN